MKIIGITGGIGSGKSTVCSIFRQLGVPVYDADKAARKLYDKNPDLLDKIRSGITSEVFNESGQLDRRKLAEIVFKDQNKLEKLNAIVHPLVKKDFQSWLQGHQDTDLIIKEAAILFESGSHKDCDKIITVVSPKELRIQRIRDRDRKSKQDIEEIINKQWSDEEKIKKSDYVIQNDEKDMLIPQVLAILQELAGEEAKVKS